MFTAGSHTITCDSPDWNVIRYHSPQMPEPNFPDGVETSIDIYYKKWKQINGLSLFHTKSPIQTNSSETVQWYQTWSWWQWNSSKYFSTLNSKATLHRQMLLHLDKWIPLVWRQKMRRLMSYWIPVEWS
jgi:hypothetical protein